MAFWHIIVWFYINGIFKDGYYQALYSAPTTIPSQIYFFTAEKNYHAKENEIKQAL